MALSEKKIAQVKVSFEAGKLSRAAIGKKHKISQPTLKKLADERGWEYKKNFIEISDHVSQKSLERLIEQEIDIATKTNENFQKNIAYIEGVAMAYMVELGKAKSGKDKQSKEEADRIFSFLKSCKISSEIMNMNYNGKRKMLGMDREEELKRLAPRVDPTEGLTEAEIDAKLADI